jgi:hypothetical protein
MAQVVCALAAIRLQRPTGGEIYQLHISLPAGRKKFHARGGGPFQQINKN